MRKSSSRCLLGNFGSSGGLHRSRPLWMRFDKERGGAGGTDESTVPSPDEVKYRKLPDHMYPKPVSSTFTPFPLPKYDDSMGFGPVRVRDVPDIEAAKKRQSAAAYTSNTGVSWKEAGDDSEDLFQSLTGEGVEGVLTTTSADGMEESAAGGELPAQNFLGGYHVDPRLPVLDRLECDRTVDDLLAQFYDRPKREARTATVLDIANTLTKRSNAEIERLLYELSSLFAPDGNGLQFIVATVRKFGRPYTVTSELMKAFVHLVEALTRTLVEEQPHRLAESPELLSQTLHFLALIKAFEPNKWYSRDPSGSQNRADFCHPRGVNKNTVMFSFGTELYDYMAHLVSTSAVLDSGEGSVLEHCTTSCLLDIISGFAAVMPDGKPPHEAANAILAEVMDRFRTAGAVRTAADAALLERFYFILQMLDVQRDEVVLALLGMGEAEVKLNNAGFADELRRSHSGGDKRSSLSLSADAARVPRGPDFFSAVSRDKRPEIHAAALKALEVSLNEARGKEDTELTAALMESSTELLQALKDKGRAVRFARAFEFDAKVLHGTPSFETVAVRLVAEQTEQETLGHPHPLSASLQGMSNQLLGSVEAVLEHLASHPAPYIARHAGKRVHPIRTFVQHLDYIKSLDNVFLLHSSAVEKHTSILVSAVRRLKSGKDGLIVSTQCLHALRSQAAYATAARTQEAAKKALEIVSQELESGRAILVPLSEELFLHDAGTYCDEDLMLWTVAAYLVRGLPLVKVHTLLSPTSSARSPHHFLKGGHTAVSSTKDIFDPSTPLLQSLHSRKLRATVQTARMQQPVRDRAQSMFHVNPIRTRFVYRRDKALFDKYHVTARQLAPGFAQGALESDMRGLGYYTPDHPQVPYTPVSLPNVAKMKK